MCDTVIYASDVMDGAPSSTRMVSDTRRRKRGVIAVFGQPRNDRLRIAERAVIYARKTSSMCKRSPMSY
jgi:hypothetical protein